MGNPQFGAGMHYGRQQVIAEILRRQADIAAKRKSENHDAILAVVVRALVSVTILVMQERKAAKK